MTSIIATIMLAATAALITVALWKGRLGGTTADAARRGGPVLLAVAVGGMLAAAVLLAASRL